MDCLNANEGDSMRQSFIQGFFAQPLSCQVELANPGTALILERTCWHDQGYTNKGKMGANFTENYDLILFSSLSSPHHHSKAPPPPNIKTKPISIQMSDAAISVQ